MGWFAPLKPIPIYRKSTICQQALLGFVAKSMILLLTTSQQQVIIKNILFLSDKKYRLKKAFEVFSSYVIWATEPVVLKWKQNSVDNRVGILEMPGHPDERNL